VTNWDFTTYYCSDKDGVTRPKKGKKKGKKERKEMKIPKETDWVFNTHWQGRKKETQERKKESLRKENKVQSNFCVFTLTRCEIYLRPNPPPPICSTV